MKNRIIIYSLLLLIFSYSVYYLFYKWSFDDISNITPTYELVINNENINDEKISWDNDIEFTFCDWLYNYTNETKWDWWSTKFYRE